METRNIVWIALLGLGFWGFQLTASPAYGTPPTPTTLPAPPQDVIVVNTPVPVSVTGSVNVSNLPGTQPVSGTVNVSNLVTYQYAGLSIDNTTGHAGGLPGMNTLCQYTYGPDARMCNTKEFFDSPVSTANAPTDEGWIQPYYVNMYYDGSTTVYFDYSGLYKTGSAPDCSHWNSLGSGDAGIVYWESGSIHAISFLGCSSELQVVCCVPAQ